MLDKAMHVIVNAIFRYSEILVQVMEKVFTVSRVGVRKR